MGLAYFLHVSSTRGKELAGSACLLLGFPFLAFSVFPFMAFI